MENNNNLFSEEAMLAPANPTDFERAAADAIAAQKAIVEAVETTIVETPAQPVVETPAYRAPEEVQALGSVAEGVIGATTAPKAPERQKSAKAAEVKETVALFSTKNVTWPGVGKVYRGYNIVEKDAATQWLTRSHIKPATPEEVAKEFGK
jgi:hypothetical protein